MDRKLKPRSWLRRHLAAVAAGAGLLGLGGWLVIPGEGGTLVRVSGGRIQTAAVREGAFQEYLPLVGSVIPVSTLYLDATEGGRIEEVFRRAGSFVEAGDPILRLANTTLLLDVMYRESELFQQRNNLQNTRIALEQDRLRMKAELLDLDRALSKQQRIREGLDRLFEAGLAPRQDAEDAREEVGHLTARRDLLEMSQTRSSELLEGQLRQLEDSVARMQRNLDIVRERMETLVVRAPVAGQLTSLDAEVGQLKERGQRLGQIDAPDGFKIRADVDEHYISRVTTDLPASVSCDGREYSMKVEKVYPEVQGGRFEVDLRFDPREPAGIRRGQRLHLHVELDQPETSVLLPRGSFDLTTAGRWVYVLDADGRSARKREVTLGRQNPMYHEVLEGLEPGEKVIVSSYARFGDADRLVLGN